MVALAAFEPSRLQTAALEAARASQGHGAVRPSFAISSLFPCSRGRCGPPPDLGFGRISLASAYARSRKLGKSSGRSCLTARRVSGSALPAPSTRLRAGSQSQPPIGELGYRVANLEQAGVPSDNARIGRCNYSVFVTVLRNLLLRGVKIAIFVWRVQRQE